LLVRIPQQHSASFAIGPRGKVLAISAIEGDGQQSTQYLDVRNGTTGKRISRIRHDGDVDAVFNPQGDRLLLIHDTQLDVFDAATGRATLTLGHEQDIQRGRMSAEDGILATVAGGNVYVWNYRTGQLLSQLTAAGYVLDVRFSADGRYLLTGSNDHTAALWLWKTDDLRAVACARMSRNLMRAEWARYLGTTPYRQTCRNLDPDPRT
jgi:WD40 repeat protein